MYRRTTSKSGGSTRLTDRIDYSSESITTVIYICCRHPSTTVSGYPINSYFSGSQQQSSYQVNAPGATPGFKKHTSVKHTTRPRCTLHYAYMLKLINAAFQCNELYSTIIIFARLL